MIKNICAIHGSLAYLCFSCFYHKLSLLLMLMLSLTFLFWFLLLLAVVEFFMVNSMFREFKRNLI